MARHRVSCELPAELKDTVAWPQPPKDGDLVSDVLPAIDHANTQETSMWLGRKAMDCCAQRAERSIQSIVLCRRYVYFGLDPHRQRQPVADCTEACRIKSEGEGKRFAKVAAWWKGVGK